MKRSARFIILVLVLFFSNSIFAKKEVKASEAKTLKDMSLHGLTFRSIGPAVTGGRIAAIAVDPLNPSTYFVGSGHGNLWKTTNNGMTFSPIFDDQGAYAIGAIAIDPTNSNVIWVGTGENNCQSNSGYGDGVYRSEDGGKSWQQMGLKESEHIGGIVINPDHPDTVLVAAYGPQRRSGGDRGIFKTTDGGKTWERVLYISDHTGFFQIQMNPENPEILFASAHQRMRRHYTSVYGGPESGIYRSTDSGATWKKLTNGLPKEDMGRIGLAISPCRPDIVFAIIEAAGKDGGFYRSLDRGASWSKQGDYVSTYPFYFQKIVADPVDPERVYSMDVFLKVTNDGGKSWKKAGSNLKHVDDHCMWIDPKNNQHLIAGCDGGVYESYDQARNWSFKSNLPIAEIYKITADNAKPFYNVYIGTQDNSSLVGPSKTINSGGITNQDWRYTNTGDGFETQVDWQDPNIVYAQAQFGGLVRFDRQSGERLDIKPYEFEGEAFRFDWDAALLISRHDHKRLYFGGNKVLKTEDKGNSWSEISPDLSRGVPQELEEVMGQSWSIDQLARKGSMANIVTIAESPLNDKKLFVGSGDGLIHFTDDGGATWEKAMIKGLPEYSRVHQIIASRFDVSIAYAACHDLLGGDYRPFLYKTIDGGKSWNPMNGNLPERGSTYSIAEDHVNKDLLFTGTQFGVYFSLDGGQEWIKLKSGIPSHCVMDLEIQRDADDLIVSTFGRGIYILDDYSALRDLSEETMKKEAQIFPIKDAQMFIQANPFGFRGNGFMGADFFSAPNPEPGAVFTYFLRDEIKTLKEKRREEEKENQKGGLQIKHPSYETLLSEMDEPESFLFFSIFDERGDTVRRIKVTPKKGVNRMVWDFRTAPVSPVSGEKPDMSVPWNEPDLGFMVVPGEYQISLNKWEQGTIRELAAPTPFKCQPLNINSLPASDKPELDAFNKKVAELTRVILGADSCVTSLIGKMDFLKKAAFMTSGSSEETLKEIMEIEHELKKLNRTLNGDPLRRRFDDASPTSIRQRVDLITSSLWQTTAAPTHTFRKSYDAVAAQAEGLLVALNSIKNRAAAVEETLEKAGAPSTPDRIPDWKK